MKELLYIGKLLGAWIVIQLAWAGIGYALVEANDLYPSNGQIYAFVAFPYLALFTYALVDTLRND